MRFKQTIRTHALTRAELRWLHVQLPFLDETVASVHALGNDEACFMTTSVTAFGLTQQERARMGYELAGYTALQLRGVRYGRLYHEI